MDVDESMEGVDEEVESMMAELGVPPEEPEKPEHVATAYLRTQLEVGLTPRAGSRGSGACQSPS